MLDIDAGTLPPRLQLRGQLHAVVRQPPALRHPATRRRFGARFQRDWESYRDYNGAFAEALAEEAGARARGSWCRTTT